MEPITTSLATNQDNYVPTSAMKAKNVTNVRAESGRGMCLGLTVNFTLQATGEQISASLWSALTTSDSFVGLSALIYTYILKGTIYSG